MSDKSGTSNKAAQQDWKQNFQQCLELLRGPGDERRFVGLLLVTRLLPAGSDEAVRQVLGALCFQFINRLLLPLAQNRPSQNQQQDHEASQQAATGCGLALAILAAGCRLPEIAAGPDVRQLRPLLLKVVRQCGVTGILQAGRGPAEGPAAAGVMDAADAAAVTDALECLLAAEVAAAEVAAAEATGCQSAVIGLDAVPYAMEALASWLTSAAATLTAAPPGAARQEPRSGSGTAATAVHGPPSAEGDMAAAVEVQVHNGTLLAAALLERLLVGGSGSAGLGRTVAVLVECPTAAAAVMAALAAFFGNPRLLLPAAPGGAMLQNQQQQQGQQQKQDRLGSGSGASGGSGGAAQLQLEALHLLLLLLRGCQEHAAAPAAAALIALDEQRCWSAAARRGLGWLLRSRAPSGLKHTALQLAACVVGLVGEGWLLGRGGAGGDGGGGGRGSGADVGEACRERAEDFLLVLTETLKIETGLLLHDALHPDRSVPGGTDVRAATLGNRPPPQPSQRILDDLATRAAARKAAAEAAVAAAVAASGSGAAGPAAASTSSSPGEQVDPDRGTGTDPMVLGAAGGGPSTTGDAGGLQGPPPPGDVGISEAAAGGGGGGARMGCTTAGERALALLPACFQLSEAAIGAVAADAAAADGAADMEMCDAVAAEGPVLSDATLRNLMAAFEATVDLILQFFEAATEQPPNQSPQSQPPSHSSGAATSALTTNTPTGRLGSVSGSTVTPTVTPMPTALLLGASRVLGRYLAEAPGAVRSERMLVVLPRVMAVGCGSGGGGGVDRGDKEAGEEEDSALQFLLPGLLQATSSGTEGRQEVIRSLGAAPGAVDACVTYLARCVKHATAAANHITNTTTKSNTAGRSALLATEQSLADVSMLLLNLLDPALVAKMVATVPQLGKQQQQQPATSRNDPVGESIGSSAAAAAAAGTARVAKDGSSEGRGGGGGDGGGGSRFLSPAWEVLGRMDVTLSVHHPLRDGGGGKDGDPFRMEMIAAAASAADQQLPPGLVRVQPVCWLVGRWATARASALKALDSQDLLHHPDGAAATLAAVQLRPRVLLCTSCLAAVVAAATLRHLTNAVNAQESASQHTTTTTTPSATSSSHVAGTATTAPKALLADAAAALLPPPLLERLYDAALAAAAAGSALEFQQMLPETAREGDDEGDEDTMMGEAGGAGRPGAGAGGCGGGGLSVAAVAADYPGDGQVAWERLLGACVQLVEMSGRARERARGAVWLRGLLGAGGGGAVAWEPALALLLQVVGTCG